MSRRNAERAPNPPAEDETEAEDTEDELEPPPRRATDSPSITIPGEATHWRARRVVGEKKSDRLTWGNDAGGVQYTEWPVEEFSVAECRRRWGTGEIKVQWILREQGQKTLLLGGPVTFVIGPPADAAPPPVVPGPAPRDVLPYAPMPGASYVPNAAPATPANVPFFAPVTGGILAESFGYFEKFSAMFLQSWQFSQTQARVEIEAQRERDRLHHERVMREQDLTHARQLELLRLTMSAEKPALSADELRAIVREELAAGEEEDDEDEEDEDDDDQEQAPADGAAPEASTPEAKPEDTMGKIADIGNAVGNALEQGAKALGEANKLAANVRELVPAVKGALGEADGSRDAKS